MLTLDDAPDEAAFREEVRAWADASLPTELRWRTDFEGLLQVERRLSAAGLLAITWPARFGGRGLEPRFDAVLTDELGKVGVRRTRTPSQQGVNNFGPALIRHGTEAQRQRFLPEILAMREVWCQGFSEPDAGSDLANIRTTARLDGERLVVNGSKLWTSNAQHAHWMYALVRTGEPGGRSRGLSVVVVSMSSPGVTVRPIVQLTATSEFCEVFLDDVAIPVDAVIGDMGDGWNVARTVLTSERLSGRLRHTMYRREIDELVAQLRDRDVDDDASLAQLGAAIVDIEGIGALSMRIDSMRNRGGDTAALASVNKLWWPAAHQRLAETALGLATTHRCDPAPWYERWLESRAESIYGGTAQIQRSILAERHLGLPR